MSENLRRFLSPQYRNLRFIWLAMQAAVAVIGLVMAIVTRDASNTALFTLAAFALLVTTHPRAEPYLQWAARRSV